MHGKLPNPHASAHPMSAAVGVDGIPRPRKRRRHLRTPDCSSRWVTVCEFGRDSRCSRGRPLASWNRVVTLRIYGSPRPGRARRGEIKLAFFVTRPTGRHHEDRADRDGKRAAHTRWAAALHHPLSLRHRLVVDQMATQRAIAERCIQHIGTRRASRAGPKVGLGHPHSGEHQDALGEQRSRRDVRYPQRRRRGWSLPPRPRQTRRGCRRSGLAPTRVPLPPFRQSPR